MTKEISSIHNPLIKSLYQLKVKSKVRQKQGLFLIEGQREISLALKSDYQIQSIVFQPDIITEEEVRKFVPEHIELISVSKEVYEKLAYRDSTQGMLALVETKNQDLKNLKLTSRNPLILVAEAPEKPGNIGALLRTADAANVDAVIIANPKTDLYNPNIIRSSVGCLFTNTIATGTTTEIIQFLKNHNIGIYCAALQASDDYHKQDYTKPTAIVVGTEATGLSQEWLDNATQNIIIPMQGEIDSMNVSVAAGILVFEAKRQRGFE
ncbi:MAG: RNA methyltransferase [Flavobacteriaceae bacterium]|nr:MAG: RNA methyltransferase [Flavobacteriaceae bacterium]